MPRLERLPQFNRGALLSPPARVHDGTPFVTLTVPNREEEDVRR